MPRNLRKGERNRHANNCLRKEPAGDMAGYNLKFIFAINAMSGLWEIGGKTTASGTWL